MAAKNIEPGEVIIREEPIAVGPATYRKDCFCFACLRSLTKISGGKQYVCSKCNIASLCSVACEVTNYKIHNINNPPSFRTPGKCYYIKQKNILQNFKKCKYFKIANCSRKMYTIFINLYSPKKKIKKEL